MRKRLPLLVGVAVLLWFSIAIASAYDEGYWLGKEWGQACRHRMSHAIFGDYGRTHTYANPGQFTFSSWDRDDGFPEQQDSFVDAIRGTVRKRPSSWRKQWVKGFCDGFDSATDDLPAGPWELPPSPVDDPLPR